MKKEKKIDKKANNILYTGYGDKGTTTLFGCKQERVSKSANIIEALGSLDELNAYLGVVKVHAGTDNLCVKVGAKKVAYIDILGDIQQVLFVIQAELAGSKMTVSKKSVIKIENIIHKISDLLPPITSFTISGGSLASAELDVARTLARRAERRVVSVSNEKIRIIGTETISYLNRLSSILFALSRYANHLYSIDEDHPNYLKNK
ncbi:MAG: cob(I)yrinic acid a,c-diamide adenosyltransferase [Patescibacteria group bacterium]|nr:cob(I)yrinic acid a,c-diamide adenosyltransferase [Patescibacteria group bacterium]